MQHWCLMASMPVFQTGCTGSNPVCCSITGCSSVWLERLIWDQEAGGSSPSTPTIHINTVDVNIGGAQGQRNSDKDENPSLSRH